MYTYRKAQFLTNYYFFFLEIEVNSTNLYYKIKNPIFRN